MQHQKRVNQRRKASVETQLKAHYVSCVRHFFLHVFTEAKMSFQHDEQEFDFSYMFEYNRDVQDEPKVGEFPSAKAYPLYYILCIMQF